jgi:hypothetical protein
MRWLKLLFTYVISPLCAAGGGAFVIPYLTVYAVLPVSVIFLFLFSAASHRMSRAALFNTILVVFMAFFGGFALVLYPNADVLHPHALADQMQQVCHILYVCEAVGHSAKGHRAIQQQQQEQQEQHSTTSSLQWCTLHIMQSWFRCSWCAGSCSCRKARSRQQ